PSEPALVLGSGVIAQKKPRLRTSWTVGSRNFSTVCCDGRGHAAFLCEGDPRQSEQREAGNYRREHAASCVDRRENCALPASSAGGGQAQQGPGRSSAAPGGGRWRNCASRC